MGCGGNRLEVDGEAVVEANSSSVQERIQYHKGVVDGLDVEIRKQATLETNAVDEIDKLNPGLIGFASPATQARPQRRRTRIDLSLKADFD
ncbi:hypothetical protein YC2023_121135 [Brassica napus]